MKNSANKLMASFGEKILIFILTLFIGTCFVVYESIKNNGNESNAVSFISLINNKQKQYASEHKGNFSSNFNELDERFSGNTVSFDGYTFRLTTTPRTDAKSAFYSITADPQNYLYFFNSKTRHFYFDSTLAVIKSTEESRQASAKDPTL